MEDSLQRASGRSGVATRDDRRRRIAGGAVAERAFSNGLTRYRRGPRAGPLSRNRYKHANQSASSSAKTYWSRRRSRRLEPPICRLQGLHVLKKQAAALTVAGLIAATASFDSRAQSGTVNLTALDLAYQENFDTLAIAGTSSLLPAGWEILETGTNANLTYTAGTGSGNAGDTYSFGSTAATDRALGGLFSGSLTPLFGVGVLQQHRTADHESRRQLHGRAVAARHGRARRSTRFPIQRRCDGAGHSAPGRASTPSTSCPRRPPSLARWTAILPQIARLFPRSSPESRLRRDSTIRFRWQDFNASGADDGLAVDDVSVTPHGGGGGPILSIADASVTEGNGGAVTATFTVTVSTATHPGITFDIATVDGTGAAAATVADGDYVSRALTSVTLPTGETTFAFDVTINGDTTVEPTETFSVVLSAVTGATLADGTALGTIVNDDDPPPVVSDVVISQVYGGGGNSGAPLKNDYIELFNRGTSAISLDGWSVQDTRREPDDCLASHAAHRHDCAEHLLPDPGSRGHGRCAAAANSGRERHRSRSGRRRGRSRSSPPRRQSLAPVRQTRSISSATAQRTVLKAQARHQHSRTRRQRCESMAAALTPTTTAPTSSRGTLRPVTH